MGDISYPRTDSGAPPPPAGAFQCGTTLYLPRVSAGKILAFEGWRFTKLEYTKRASAEHEKLRREFNSSDGVRGAFLRDLANTHRNELVAAGFNAAQIKLSEAGRPPRGFQVHHKIPLDDGGTNQFSNLVLIRNQSEHTAITAYQNSTIRQLARGETRRIDFPTPPESLRVHPKSVTSLSIEHKLYKRK